MERVMRVVGNRVGDDCLQGFGAKIFLRYLEDNRASGWPVQRPGGLAGGGLALDHAVGPPAKVKRAETQRSGSKGSLVG